MNEHELPEGYWIDESGVDCVVLYYLMEKLGVYRHHSPQVVFDAETHKKNHALWTDEDEADYQLNNIGAM